MPRLYSTVAFAQATVPATRAGSERGPLERPCLAVLFPAMMMAVSDAVPLD